MAARSKRRECRVENVAGERLTAGRAAEQEGHLSVSRRLLRKIVINDQRMHAVVAEILAHGAAGIGGEELQRRALRCGRGDHDRVLHRAGVFEGLHHLRDRGALLTDGDINAIELFALIVALIDRLLIDEGVDRNRGLAGLAVANDQLTLATAHWNETVDRLQAGLHRLTETDWRGMMPGAFTSASRRSAASIGPLPSKRIAKRVDHAAKQALAHRHVHNVLGALDRVTFFNVTVIAERSRYRHCRSRG